MENEGGYFDLFNTMTTIAEILKSELDRGSMADSSEMMVSKQLLRYIIDVIERAQERGEESYIAAGEGEAEETDEYKM